MIFLSPERPTLFLDEWKCKRNINKIASKAAQNGIRFTPHFKTHQSLEIGEWFRDEGVISITVSSVKMASYFASGGWNDITIAFPFFRSQISALKHLERSVNLRLFVNNPEDVFLLNDQLQNSFRVIAEMDPGYGRSGIESTNQKGLESLMEACQKTEKATFSGFYIHDGRTYQTGDPQRALEQGKSVLDLFSSLKSTYPGTPLIFGDTPSASLLDHFGDADEITPGNFVFYDWMQVLIGSCSIDEVALFCQLPVAQKRPELGHWILHGGAAHLSKDFVHEEGSISYGQTVELSGKSVTVKKGCYISSLSQEHGVMKVTCEPDIRDAVTICPIHSCLTANLHDHYLTTDGRRIEKRILS